MLWNIRQFPRRRPCTVTVKGMLICVGHRYRCYVKMTKPSPPHWPHFQREVSMPGSPFLSQCAWWLVCLLFCQPGSLGGFQEETWYTSAV
ncbi:hypothetical protein GOP47_0010519, partial [Adiantum capillus-veneris]